MDALVSFQRSILAAAWEKLAPGGSLVYLTCTLNPVENEEQIVRFLEQCPDAKLLGEFRTGADSPLREFFYGARISRLSGKGMQNI